MVVCCHLMTCLQKMSAVHNEDNGEKHSLTFKKLVRIGVLAILTLIILFLIVRIFPNYQLILKKLFKIAIPFVFAILLTYLLNPIVEKMSTRYIPRWLAILIIYAVIIGGVGLLIYYTFPTVKNQIIHFIDQLPLLLRGYQSWINQFDQMIGILPAPFDGEVDLLIQRISGSSVVWLEDKVLSLGVLREYIVSLAVVPVLLYYFLLDRGKIKMQLMNLIPKRYQKRSKQLIFHLNKDLAHYIRAQLIISLFVGIATYIVYLILKIEYSLLLSLFMMVMNIVPYFGPFLGATPAVLIALTSSGNSVLYLIIGILIIQSLENSIISPFILGYTIRTHPVLVILVLLIGNEVAGVFGMIIAVPVLVIIRSVKTYYPFQKS